MMFAVAGTMARTSASRTSEMCGIFSGSSQSEEYTGLRVNAANVAMPMNSRAPSLKITVTSSPRWTSVDVSAAAL